MSRSLFPELDPELNRFFDGTNLQHPKLGRFEDVNRGMFARLNHSMVRENIFGSPEELQNVIFKLLDGEPISQYFETVGAVWTNVWSRFVSSSLMQSLILIGQGLGLDPADMMTACERHVWASLPEPLTVYRGHALGLRDGISWSRCPIVAQRYALGFPQNSQLTLGTVRKREVIAYIDRWDEEEILVHSRDVVDVLTLEQTTA